MAEDKIGLTMQETLGLLAKLLKLIPSHEVRFANSFCITEYKQFGGFFVPNTTFE